MEARVSIVTLGVDDIERAVRFYRDGLGWPLSGASASDLAVFRTGGVLIVLYPRSLLAADAGVSSDSQGFGGITLAHNVAESAQVDAVLTQVAAAGATILKPAQNVFWGGRSGYFADPDGHVWEVAWNPHWPLDERGVVQLPE